MGITSTFFFFLGGGVNMSCSRTQHGDPSGARTPDFWIRSRGVNHQATAPQTDIVVPPLIIHWKYDNYLFAVVKLLFFHFSRPFSELFLVWDLDAITLKKKCKK